MVRWIAVVLLLFTEGVRADEAAIKEVIGQQIAAFRADEFETAFTYASPGIRSRFGTVEAFEEMVKRGYPVLRNPVDMQFLGLSERDGGLWQRVLFRDLHGDIYIYDYEMTEGPERWTINAVERVPMPSPSG